MTVLIFWLRRIRDFYPTASEAMGGNGCPNALVALFKDR